MDNIRFYDRCLNSEEIYDLYANNPGCRDPWKTGGSVGLTSNSLSNSTILSQNVPNPFSNETTITYSIPTSVTNASIEVYDMVGKKIAAFPLSTKGESSLKITSEFFLAASCCCQHYLPSTSSPCFVSRGYEG